MSAPRLLLPFVLLAACAETSTASPPSSPVATEDDPLSMIPAEADLVLWADMTKLRSSPWTRASFEKVAGGETAEHRFDQVRQVERLVFAKVPSLGDGVSLLVAHGAIERAGLLAAFGKDGPTSTASYRGAELVTRGKEALAFAGQRKAISGPTIAVRAALDCDFGVARAIDSEPWFQRMRNDLVRDRPTRSLVAALYVHLQPATREILMQEMGEGGSLEELAVRVDLDENLQVTALGAVPTEAEARDLAGRLGERLRDASVRPIVSAFGFASALDAVRFEAKGTRVVGTLRVSEPERAQIAQRMAAVADMMAKLHQTEERPRP